MAEARFIKVQGGLAPQDPEAEALLARTKVGDTIKGNFTVPRNGPFHKKFFALLNFAFDNWEAPENRKSRENFRGEVIVLAGFYEQVWSIDGELKTLPKSISWAKMDDLEFAELYSAVVDVVLEKILTKYTRDDLENVINQLLSFT